MNKNSLALLSGMVYLFGTVTPCLAEVYTEPTTAPVPITFEQESTFTVTLPENIKGANGQKSADFNYSVQGDIASNKLITVNIDDADTTTEGIQVVLKDILNNEKFANISIEKNTYAYDEINTEYGCTNNGLVTFEGLTAGNWTGNAKFIIGLETINSDISMEAGLYDTDGNMLCSWEDSGILADIDYSETSYATETTSGYYVLTNTYPNVTKIVFPNTITKIGNNAFYDCDNLTSIIIPSSVTSIGTDAFRSCDNLTDVTIPSSVTYFGSCAFSSTPWVSEQSTSSENGLVVVNNILIDSNSIMPLSIVTIPDGVRYIADSACAELSTNSVIISNSVVSIGNEAFDNCNNLTSVTISDSVENLGENAFKYCGNLSNVTMGTNVKTIGDFCFRRNTSLSNITIPDSITDIGNKIFDECINLNSITYKGTTYTSKGTLVATLTENGVILAEDIFGVTGLQD